MRRILSRPFMSGVAAAGLLLRPTVPSAIAQAPARPDLGYYYPAPATTAPAPGYYYYPAPSASRPNPGYYYYPAPAYSYPAPGRGFFGFPRGRVAPQPGDNDTYAYKS